MALWKSPANRTTEKEKALIGKWYHDGDINQPCWIAAAGNTLFAINNENQDGSRIVLTSNGFIFSSKWKQRAEIVEDKILWANGVWWSRKPMDFGTQTSPTALKQSYIVPD